MEPIRKDPSGIAMAPVLPSCCGMPPWCLVSGVAAFCACRVWVRASILRSSSATRLSAFFWRLRVGGVVMHARPAFAHRLHETSGRSWSQRTCGVSAGFCAQEASTHLQSATRIACPGALAVSGRFGRPRRCVRAGCRSASSQRARSVAPHPSWSPSSSSCS
jgi:hypothetical protein